MNQEQIALVQTSFERVAALGPDNVAQIFYKRLFELDPDLRAMFKEDMADQRAKLMRMLGTAVNGLNNIGPLVPAISALGQRHVAYAVKPEHYSTVGKALIDTLAARLGDEFDEPLQTAWTECFTAVSQVMLEGARKAKPEPIRRGQ